MMMMIKVIQYLFYTYTLMIAARVIASWFPAARGADWLYWVARCTDPYLNIFRRFIPPIGGVLDLSPLLAYFSLQFLEYLILKLFL